MHRRRLIGFGMALLLAGCGGSPPPPPVVLTLTIKGAATLNPAPGVPTQPVAVRLYQLAASGKFQSTDVYTLMGQEAAALGTEELTTSEQLPPISPGQSVVVVRTLKPGAQFLGVAVLFYDIGKAQWQQMIPLPASGPVAATLNISGITATLALAK